MIYSCYFPSSLPIPLAAQNRHPNVILISLDQCRADELHVYGNMHQTSPSLDRIAGEGVSLPIAEHQISGV